MRTRIIISTLALVAALVFASCSNDETTETVAPQGKATVVFNVANYQQVSFDDIEEATRAATSNLPHLTLGIYNANTLELVQEVTQDNGDDDFGSFTVTLSFGEYFLTFLGYTSDYTPDMTNPKSISFGDTYVPNLFWAKLDLTVNSEDVQSKSVTLEHVVGGFRVYSTDVTDTPFLGIHFKVEGSGDAIDATTGRAANTVSRDYKAWSSSGNTMTTLSGIVYGLLEGESGEIDATLIPITEDGTEIKEHTFYDVPITVNQLTIYRGIFFTDYPEGDTQLSVGLPEDAGVFGSTLEVTYSFWDK